MSSSSELSRPGDVAIQRVDGPAQLLVIERGEVGAMDARGVGVEDVIGERAKVGTKMDRALDHQEASARGLDSRNPQRLRVETLPTT